MRESVVQFGPARGLVGIATEPLEEGGDPDLPAIVLLNAGLLHRVGPNRLYVQIARALAAHGHTVLRFDFSGMGDSQPRTDHLPYAQSAPAEACAAMDWLALQRGARQFILIGHCAGAIFALLTSRDDPRVAGAVLINFEGGDAQWTEFDRRSKASRYHSRNYLQRGLFSRERWLKLLSGRADYRSITQIVLKDIFWYRLTGLGFHVRQALRVRKATTRADQRRNAQAYLDPITQRGAALLLVHSEGSTGLKQIRAAFGAELERDRAAGLLELTIIPQSDHLFTPISRQRQLSGVIAAWVDARFGPASLQLMSAVSGHSRPERP